MEEDAVSRYENKFKQWFSRTFKMNTKSVTKESSTSFTLPRSLKESGPNNSIDHQELTAKAITFHKKHSGLNEAPKFIGLLKSEYHIKPVQNAVNFPADQEMLFIFEPILLYCYVQPTAQDVVFIWQKDSVEIHPSDRIDILCQDTATQLRISNPNISDNGDYDCIAVNPEGRCSTHTQVLIKISEETEKLEESIIPKGKLKDSDNSFSQKTVSGKLNGCPISVSDHRKPYRLITHYEPLGRISFRRTVCYSKRIMNTNKNDNVIENQDMVLKFNSVSECENIIFLNDKHIGSRRYYGDKKGWKYNSFRYLRSYDMNQTPSCIPRSEDKELDDIFNNEEFNTQKLASIKDFRNSNSLNFTETKNSCAILKRDQSGFFSKDEVSPLKHSLKKLNASKRRHQSSTLLSNGDPESPDCWRYYYQEQLNPETINITKCRVRKRHSFATDSFRPVTNGNNWKLLPKTSYDRSRKQSTTPIHRAESLSMSKSTTVSDMKSISEFLFCSNILNISQQSATGSSISDVINLSGLQSPKSAQRSWSDIDLHLLNNGKLVEVRLLNEPNKENQQDAISNAVQEIIMQYTKASRNSSTSIIAKQDCEYRFIDDEGINHPETTVEIPLKYNKRKNFEEGEENDYLQNETETVTVLSPSTLCEDGKANDFINCKQNKLSVSDCDESENHVILSCSKVTSHSLVAKEKDMDALLSPAYQNSLAGSDVYKHNIPCSNSSISYFQDKSNDQSLKNCQENSEFYSTRSITATSSEQHPPEPVKRRPHISSILIDKRLGTSSRDKNINASTSLSNILSDLPVDPIGQTRVGKSSKFLDEPTKRKASDQQQCNTKMIKLTRSRRYTKKQYKFLEREGKSLIVDKNDNILENDNNNHMNPSIDSEDNFAVSDVTSRSNLQNLYPRITSNSLTSNHKEYKNEELSMLPNFDELDHSHQKKISELIQRFQTSKATCISPSKQVIYRIPRLNKQSESLRNNEAVGTNEPVDSTFYSTIGVDNMITKQILKNSSKTSVRSKISSSSSSSTSSTRLSSLSQPSLQPTNDISPSNQKCLLSFAENDLQMDAYHETSQMQSVIQPSEKTNPSLCPAKDKQIDKHGDFECNSTNSQIKGSYESVCYATSTETNNSDDSKIHNLSVKKYSTYSREEVKRSQCKVIKRESYVNRRKMTPERQTSTTTMMMVMTTTTTTVTSKHSSKNHSPLSQNVSDTNGTLDSLNAKTCELIKTTLKPSISNILEVEDSHYVKCSSEIISSTCKSLVDENEYIEYPLKISTIKNVNPCDHYEEVGVLGYGTYGHVIKCREIKTGSIFAAKKFKILRLKRHKGELMEVAVLRAIGKHPQIAHLHAAYEHNIYCTIITEYVPGGALYNRIEKEGSLDEAITVSIVRQVLLGLKHLQDCSVIHRDLKPENLMMVQSSGYRLKIIDFGLAMFYSGSLCPPIPAGTLTYIAPETQNCDPQTYTTDLWSVAVIAYEILAGITPFEIPQDGCRDRTLTNHEISLNITHVRYDFDDPGIVDVSNEAKDFIKQILVRDPNKRPSVHQCLKHPWMAMREEDRPPVKRTVSLFRHSTRRKPKGCRIKAGTTQKCDPCDS
ncbi:unnamed protein product [Heterobilharzia americana]|nr:unnamed protein product [Heterobilharzia americana]